MQVLFLNKFGITDEYLTVYFFFPQESYGVFLLMIIAFHLMTLVHVL